MVQRWSTPPAPANGGRWGARHRVDGPALLRVDGFEQWWQHGQLHRDDGPAETLPDGTRSWYLRGLLRKVARPRSHGLVAWRD